MLCWSTAALSELAEAVLLNNSTISKADSTEKADFLANMTILLV
jgi:hypothetical protein